MCLARGAEPVVDIVLFSIVISTRRFGVYETLRVLDPDADIHHKAWREGEELVGEGVVNDKGPMAAFLIAAKSLKLAASS